MKVLIVIALLLVGIAIAENADFIIVGGGTAGCVIAAELSADPNNEVLVLDHGDDISEITTSVAQLWGTRVHGVGGNFSKFYSWNYFVDVQQSTETNNDFRSLVAPKPKLLGGGSSINGVAWSRPSKATLAAWNDSLWTYEATLEDFKAIESCRGGAASCNPLYHGFDGPIVTNTFVERQNSHHTLLNGVFKSTFGFTDNPDVNGPVSQGFGALPRNLDVGPDGNPIRQDSYNRFLKPVLGRPNLKVLTGAKVRTITLKKNGKNQLEFDYRGQIEKVTAKREVILSAGTHGSPTILMRSGIGNCDYLKTIDIECQVHNPQVGQNLKDGVLSSFIYATPFPASNNSYGSISVGYYRSPNHTGPTNNMEVAFAPFSPAGNVFLVMLGQLVQSAVGEIKLYNNNMHRDPLVTFNFYSNPNDVLAMIDVFRKVRQAFATVSAGGLPFAELHPGFNTVAANATDAQIEAYFRSTVNPEAHCIGTCSLGKVVDSRLRLKSAAGEVIKGLRVADNSIIPELLAEHATSAAAVLIGKVASRLIKEDWQ